jgi:hypothetical protein
MSNNAKQDLVTSEIDLDDIDETFIDLTMVDETVKPIKEPKAAPQKDDGEGDDFTLELNEIDLDPEDIQEDDTPKKKTEAPPTEDEDDVEDEEVAVKGGKKSRAQERIQQLANEKKQLAAEKAQAEAVAAALVKHMQEIEKERQDQSTKYIETDAQLWETAVTTAESELASAYDEADSKKIAAAQKKLNDAQLKHTLATARQSNVKTTTATPEDVVKSVVENAYRTNPVKQVEPQNVDNPTAVGWITKNQFVLQRQDIANTASTLFNQLQAEGMDPASDDIFVEIEDRLSIVHPELDRWFSKNKTGTKKQEETAQPEKKKQSAPPAAAPSRSTSSQPYQVKDGKVVVTPTTQDRQMAESLGLDLKEYMKEKIKYDVAAKRGSRATAIFD